MGLDMSLYKKTYVRSDKFILQNEFKDIKPERIVYVIEDIGYWRKANAIHNWILHRVGLEQEDTNGVDVPLTREDLEELLITCKTVLKNSKLVKGIVKNGYTIMPQKGREANIEMGKYIADPSVAKELLPTTEGFFFGSQDYDQYYYADVKDTIGILEEALKAQDFYSEFIYNANW